MIKKNIFAALAVVGLASAPVMAQVAAPVEAESELGGGSAGLIAAGFIAGILAIGVFAFADGDDDDAPVSP